MPFTYTWNAAFEAAPADAEDINLGASRIRALKVAVHERLAVDHSWAGDAYDGLHKHVELRPTVPTPTPVNASDGILYTQVVSGVTELFYKDNAGHILQLTQNGSLLAVNFHMTGSAVLDGNVVIGGLLTSNGDAVIFNGGIGAIEGIADFTLHNVAGAPRISLAPNTYIDWNGAQIRIVVGGVVRAAWP